MPNLDAIIVPVGGGVLSGTLAVRELDASVRIFAAEPMDADDAYRSKVAGQVPRPAPGRLPMACERVLAAIPGPLCATWWSRSLRFRDEISEALH